MLHFGPAGGARRKEIPLIPRQQDLAALDLCREMGLSKLHRAMADQFIRVSFKQAAKQRVSLLMLFYFLAMPTILEGLLSNAGALAPLWSSIIKFAMEWVPRIGVSLAAVNIALIQLGRNRLVEVMVTCGFPPIHAASMRRIATHIDIYTLTAPFARLLGKFRKPE